MKITTILLVALLSTLGACSTSTSAMKAKQQKELGELEYELRKAVLIEAIAKTKKIGDTEPQ